MVGVLAFKLTACQEPEQWGSEDEETKQTDKVVLEVKVVLKVFVYVSANGGQPDKECWLFYHCSQPRGEKELKFV